MKNNTLRFCLFLSFWVLFAAFTTAQQCQFRLDMYDDYGDGWNGGTLSISNGGMTYPFSMNDVNGDGVDSTVFFSVSSGMPMTLSWTPGSFDDEVSFSLFNNDGDLIYSVSDPSAGLLYQKNALCVACLKPLNVQVENVYDNRVKLRWTPAFAASAPIGWRVIYGKSGFVPGPGAGDTLYVNTPKATVTGLQKKTGYDFYIQQDCGNDESGGLAGPYVVETYWSDDVAIAGVLTPESGCGLGVETVTIVMHNYGANPQSLIPFNYSVNGIPAGVPMPQDGFYTGVLGKDSSTVIGFETQFNFSNPGEYLIAAWTELKGDEDTANDTFFFRVVNRLETPYTQNFETWTGGWYVDTALSVEPSWQYGTPGGTTISKAASGTHAWVTSLSEFYNTDELSYLNSPCFDFSGLTEDPVLTFSLIYATETSYDGAWLEMTLDDGASWKKIGALNEGLNWYNVNNVSTGLGPVWAGNSNGWILARHRLEGAAGQALVRLRFVFSSDGFTQFEGVGVDDIHIYAPLVADLAAISLVTAADGADCGREDDTVTFRLANFGAQSQTVFDVAYSLNGTPPVVESIGPVTLAPDAILEYTFNQTFDSRDEQFTIRCWTLLPGEQDPGNDTSAVYSVDHRPGPVPVYADFEAGLPAGWVTDGFVTDGHNNSSNVLAVNLFQFDPTSVTTLPRVGFIGPNDSLRFDYRITNYDDDGGVATLLNLGTHFDVQASADCGDTYQTLYSITALNHTPSLALQTVKVGLGAYAGQSVFIRFKSTWTAGDFFFDLDNINLQSCPASMQLSAETIPATPGQSNGSATVQVGLGNPPFHYQWSNGDTTQTATGLPTGEVTVTVTDDFGCSDILTVNILVSPVHEIEGLTRLALQPNPTRGASELLVGFDHAVDLDVQVLDLTGRVLWQTGTMHTDALSERIDLGDVPDGLYFVRLTADGRPVTRKLVKGN